MDYASRSFERGTSRRERANSRLGSEGAILPARVLPHPIKVVTDIPITVNGRLDAAAVGRLAYYVEQQQRMAWP
jgi:hypothetical protein